MLRGFLQTASFLVLGAIPALAQSHVRSHVGPRQHGPGHVAPDSATHAAIHAKLLGTWTGTLEAHHGVASDLHMSIAHDSLHRMSVMMRTDGSVHPIAVTDLTVKGDTLRWTQAMRDKTCQARSVLTAATLHATEKLQGTLVCEGVDIAFLMHRKRAEATPFR